MAANGEEVRVVEYLDVLTKTGEKTGISKPRKYIHRDGDYHRAVHIWIYAESTKELLLQQRGHPEDPTRGLWDISSAGHVSAGESSLTAAMREVQEELGISLPKDAFELIFVVLQESVFHNGTYFNNEHDDVYLVTILDPIPLEAFTLEEPQVSAVKYVSLVEYRDSVKNVPLEEYRDSRATEDLIYVPLLDVNNQYGQLFEIILKRYNENVEAKSLTLQKHLYRYAQISPGAEVLYRPQ